VTLLTESPNVTAEIILDLSEGEKFVVEERLKH
jgi:hypothetical protein